MTVVYFDMDDTLADFMKGIRDFDESKFITNLKQPRLGTIDKTSQEYIQDCMSTPGFFENLPIKRGAKALWDMAKGFRGILTAVPTNYSDAKRCSDEKYNWCIANLGLDEEDGFVSCLRSEKSQFALDNILIDDNKKNCQEWFDAGGDCIWFQSMEQATEELYSLLHTGGLRYFG